ncbi:MAG TPA: alpha/beta fold hydrolase [Candidatus Limnocylindria bacterium]|nr:alpha/beta fold hydrolase [Candidatus Limnocylindria bacterium]
MENRASWTTHHITLPDGRRAAVHRLPGDGPTVVMSHSAPGAGRFDPDPSVTDARGVSILSVDRPGYGGSDPMPSGRWASVDVAADDLAFVIEHAGLSRVGVAGWSAGGRVALALAARHPDLVERVAVIATPAPHEAVPWISPEEEAGIEAMRGMPADEVQAAFEAQMAAIVPTDTRSEAALALLGLDPEVDGPALEREKVRDELSVMLDQAFLQGARGMAADIIGYTMRPWGFEPSDVRAKTLLLYGQDDALTGQRHAAWWRAALPDARIEMIPRAGHLALVPAWGRALSHLAPRRRASAERRPSPELGVAGA